ncbi:MAG: methanogen output domain 1-containing protein [Candidatus Sericytochromatia bacterium]
MAETYQEVPYDEIPLELNRDLFMRLLITNFAHVIENLINSDMAESYVMQVGLSMGKQIEEVYKAAFDTDDFDLEQYARVIVDLKRHIHGRFYLVEATPERVVTKTTSCPFESIVKNAPSLCMMTSSVFGGIAARNFDYAKVELKERIALGHAGCTVVVHLQRTPESEAAEGQEYFRETAQASPKIQEQVRMSQTVRSLKDMNDELTRFKNLAVDRELKMVELKEELRIMQARLDAATDQAGRG